MFYLVWRRDSFSRRSLEIFCKILTVWKLRTIQLQAGFGRRLSSEPVKPTIVLVLRCGVSRVCPEVAWRHRKWSSQVASGSGPVKMASVQTNPDTTGKRHKYLAKASVKDVFHLRNFSPKLKPKLKICRFWFVLSINLHNFQFWLGTNRTRTYFVEKDKNKTQIHWKGPGTTHKSNLSRLFQTFSVQVRIWLECKAWRQRHKIFGRCWSAERIHKPKGSITLIWFTLVSEQEIDPVLDLER